MSIGMSAALKNEIGVSVDAAVFLFYAAIANLAILALAVVMLEGGDPSS